MSIKTYVVYERASGAIRREILCSTEQAACQAGPDEGCIEGAGDYSSHYVLKNKLVARPLMPITRRGNVLTSVPKGAQITIEGTDYITDDSVVEFEFSLPGSYPITVTHWPYRDWSTTIEN